MLKINTFLQKHVLAFSRDFEVNGAFKINRQARSWDHLAAILILLPTQSEMLPAGFFGSLRATGMHFGWGMRREKKMATLPRPHSLHLQVDRVNLDFNSVGEFVFMMFTYVLCLRRISLLIGNFFPNSNGESDSQIHSPKIH